MTPLLALWLPILLSAVAVFIVSSIIHMATPWHKGEYPRLPDEDAFRNAVGPIDIPPGDYMVPRASSMAEMSAPEFNDKLKKGPVAILTVLPNQPMSMTGSLIGWFFYSLVISVFAAYVASRALPPGATDMAVVRFAGVTAFAGYALGLWQMVIWYKRSLATTIKATIDGLIYALVTGWVLAFFWPV
ncbi:MAG: hypothetical protein AB1625_00240 [Acidobacteriota bacterium]